MSYDLFFLKKGDESGASAFNEYFASRRWYTVRDGHANYANQDTGVYFSFQFQHGAPAESQAAGETPCWASFNMNYVRPSIFAKEALPELEAFVEAFSLSVRDEQTHGMGEGAFSADGFLRGWRSGNAFAVGAILNLHGPHAVSATLPAAELERSWRWNLGRQQLQESLGESVFVPQIMYARCEGSVKTMCAWPDAIPVALPACDAVIVGRERPARGLLRRWRQAETEMILVERDQLDPLLANFPLHNEPIEYRLLDYPGPPADLAAFIQTLEADAPLPEGVATDAIVDEEVVRGVREKLPPPQTREKRELIGE